MLKFSSLVLVLLLMFIPNCSKNPVISQVEPKTDITTYRLITDPYMRIETDTVFVIDTIFTTDTAIVAIDTIATMRGDLDLDGDVDWDDWGSLSELLTYPKVPYGKNIDVNGDGRIDNGDLVYLGNYLQGTVMVYIYDTTIIFDTAFVPDTVFQSYVVVIVDTIFIADTAFVIDTVINTTLIATMRGDLDLDGDVDWDDYSDLSELLSYPNVPYIKSADVNGDNKVNNNDLVYLGKYLQGTGPAPISDTSFVYDTIFIPDTIFVFDTTFISDTSFVLDTVFTIDTVIVVDTVFSVIDTIIVEGQAPISDMIFIYDTTFTQNVRFVLDTLFVADTIFTYEKNVHSIKDKKERLRR